MSGVYALDEQAEAFVQAQLVTGRYGSASEVLHTALRLMAERDHRLAFLDAAIAEGIADSEADRVHGLDDVCNELDEALAVLPERP